MNAAEYKSRIADTMKDNYKAYTSSAQFRIVLLFPVFLLVLFGLGTAAFMWTISADAAPSTISDTQYLYGFDANVNDYFTEPKERDKESLTASLARSLINDLADWLGGQSFSIDKLVYQKPDYVLDENGEKIYTVKEGVEYDDQGRHSNVARRVYLMRKSPLNFEFSKNNPFGMIVLLLLRPVRRIAKDWLVIAGMWLIFKWLRKRTAYQLAEVKSELGIFVMSYVLMYVMPVLFHMLMNISAKVAGAFGSVESLNFLSLLETAAKSDAGSIGDALLYLAGTLLGLFFGANYMFMNFTIAFLLVLYSLALLKGNLGDWKESVGGLTKQIVSLIFITPIDAFLLTGVGLFVVAGVPLLYQVAAMAFIIPLRTIIRGVLGVGGHSSEMMGIGFLMGAMTLLRGGVRKGAGAMQGAKEGLDDMKAANYFEKRADIIEGSDSGSITAGYDGDEGVSNSEGETGQVAQDLPEVDSQTVRSGGASNLSDTDQKLRDLGVEHAMRFGNDELIRNTDINLTDREKAAYYRSRGKRRLARSAGRVASTGAGIMGGAGGAIAMSGYGSAGILGGAVLGYRGVKGLSEAGMDAIGLARYIPRPQFGSKSSSAGSVSPDSVASETTNAIQVRASNEMEENIYNTNTNENRVHAEFVQPEMHEQFGPALQDPYELNYQQVVEELDTWLNTELPEELNAKFRSFAEAQRSEIELAYDNHQAAIDNERNMNQLQQQYSVHNYSFENGEIPDDIQERFEMDLQKMNFTSRNEAVSRAIENEAADQEMGYRLQTYLNTAGGVDKLSSEQLHNLKEHILQNSSDVIERQPFEYETYQYRDVDKENAV